MRTFLKLARLFFFNLFYLAIVLLTIQRILFARFFIDGAKTYRRMILFTLVVAAASGGA